VKAGAELGSRRSSMNLNNEMFLRRTTKISAYLTFLWILSTGVLLWSQESASKARQPPDRAQAIYSQGMAALQKGDLEAARASFEKVVRIAPSSPDAHNSLGWVLMQ
jgi:Tfp pilus assembly protein PilF